MRASYNFIGICLTEIFWKGLNSRQYLGALAPLVIVYNIFYESREKSGTLLISHFIANLIAVMIASKPVDFFVMVHDK